MKTILIICSPLIAWFTIWVICASIVGFVYIFRKLFK